MGKILHCRDAGFDCDAVVRGETVEEIMAQVRPHAAAVHDVEIDEPAEDRIVALLRDE